MNATETALAEAQDSQPESAVLGALEELASVDELTTTPAGDDAGTT